MNLIEENQKLKKQVSDLNEELYQQKSIIYNLPGSVYWKDKQGVYLGRNHYAAQLMYDCHLEPELNVDAIIGKTDFDLFDQETASQYRASDEEVMKSKKIETSEEILHLPDGKIMTNLSIKRPLYNKEGEVIGVSGVSIDITERKEMERLKAENQHLQETVETTQLFAASIAHELRTPWGGVLLSHGLLDSIMPIFLKGYRRALEAGLLNDERRSNLPTEEMIERALEIEADLEKSAYAAKIFIDMMLLKVNMQGMEAPVVEELSMVESIDKAIELYPLTSVERKLIRWDRTENAPRDFMFRGDQTLFNHLLFNLIKNAIFYVKYANKGEISIWLSQENGGRFLHFKDTGAGMTEEVRENLFTAFFSRTRHGTGVGLALCKKIITDWGGTIECESVQDEYTHFIMSFPTVEQIK